MKLALTILITITNLFTFSQSKTGVSPVWQSDNGDGTYQNPVLYADYSDPDAIRVGDDYYLIASSFNKVPGIPILHSKDLVNWRLIGYALNKLVPYNQFKTVQHGNGVWAPAIRFHNNEFYIYYPDPDFGIYLVKSKSINGPWSEPLLVQEGKGLIDPCPFWDDNGKAYLVHAYAGSRAGIKSILVIKEMNAVGDQIAGNGQIVYDGHKDDPTIEGPKMYKRNGYYYLFAPAGGVSTGWQTVLRSKTVFGPYERRVVMDQGNSSVNGPHQGAWVTTPKGENWFLHFQDKGAYGRIVHLQPMAWENDWPVIGSYKGGAIKGEPVDRYKKPAVISKTEKAGLPDSDEFNSRSIGLQWQWQANPEPWWQFMTGTALRLYANPVSDSANNKWLLPSLLLQKIPAPEFQVITKMQFHLSKEGEQAGLILFGTDYFHISAEKRSNGLYISFNSCINAINGNKEQSLELLKAEQETIYFKMVMTEGAKCRFGYSIDGSNYKMVEGFFQAKPGKWVGASIGLFCNSVKKTNDAGYVDIDWFRFEPIAG